MQVKHNIYFTFIGYFKIYVLSLRYKITYYGISYQGNTQRQGYAL